VEMILSPDCLDVVQGLVEGAELVPDDGHVEEDSKRGYKLSMSCNSR
jgi:hypothetical protein